MKTKVKCSAFDIVTNSMIALGGVCLLMMASVEMAHAGKLTPKMVSANLVGAEIKFQTIEMHSKDYGRRELKLLQFTPKANPNYVCQGFFSVPHNAGVNLSTLATLSSYTCFPKAGYVQLDTSGDQGVVVKENKAPTVADEALIRGIENGWQDASETETPSFGTPGTVSPEEDFGGWNGTRIR